MKRLPTAILSIMLMLSAHALGGVDINVRNAPYKAKGNGTADDTAAIQKAIDYVATNGGGTITIPPGKYLTTASLNLYGDGVSFIGESGAVILVNHHFTGRPGDGGAGMFLAPVFDPQMIFSPAPTDTDGSIFITNGRGATVLIEQATGGAITSGFNELSPCEFIGRGPLLGTYDNVGTTEASAHYLKVTTPCRNITVENIAFDFIDPAADASILVKYGQSVHLKNISALRLPTVVGGRGSIGMVGCMNSTAEKILSPNIAVGLNSCRLCRVEHCDVKSVTMEESCVGNRVTGNTMRATGTIGVRINDNGCARNIITNNIIINAAVNMGAIGIWEGIDNLVTENVCRDGADSIWAGGSGNVITGNVAGTVSDYSGKNVLK